MLIKIFNTVGSNGLNMLSKLFLTLVIVQKFGAEYYGQYGLLLSIAAPIFLLLSFKSRSVLATDTSRQYLFSTYLKVVIVGVILSTLISLTIAFLLNKNILLMFLIIIVKIIENVYFTLYGQLQRDEKINEVNHSQYLYGIVGIVSLIFSYIFIDSFIATIFAYTSSVIIVCLFYDFYKIVSYWRADYLNTEKGNWLSIITQSFPFSLSSSIGSLATNTPRYAISVFLGEKMLGVYLTIYNITSLSGLLLSAVTQNFNTKLSKNYSTNYVRFSKMSRSLLYTGAFIGGIGAIGSFFGGEYVLTLLFGNEIAQYNFILVLMFLVSSLQNVTSLKGTILTSMNIYGKQLIPVTISVILGFATFPLVYLFGIYGVFLGMSFTAIFQYILLNNIFKKVINEGG